MNVFLDFMRRDSFTIFLFHGVIEKNDHSVRNYTGKHIVESRFYSFLREARKRGTALSMEEFCSIRMSHGELPPYSFAITFDDGFENNYSVAAPILEDLKIPATFYVTTGFIGQKQGTWIDRIEYAFENSGKINLSVDFSELTGTFESPEEKRMLLDRIRSRVKSDRTILADRFADEIWRQLNIKTMEMDPALDAKMTWDQVRSLSRNSLFLVGGHSHTHKILEFLSDEELSDEVDLSLGLLKEQLQGQVRHYSYPEGMPHCYSDRVIRVLKERGIVCCPTAESGTNYVGDDLFRLKRVAVV